MKKQDEIFIWEKLLSCKRLNEILHGTSEVTCRTEPRNPFERDCDRITYSYPFRRLQDKTQVIPLPVLDFVHTRLTHTLEVATVGRSLGRLLEKQLLDKGIINDDKKGDIPAILSAACLAHDIGNPPFGHSGEDSISEYFRFEGGNLHLTKIYGGEQVEIDHPKYGKIQDYEYKDIISRIKCTDLKQFEGNANGFRILTKLNNTGLNLTIATLGTFSKYPRSSYLKDETDEHRWVKDRVSQKKYGFFYSETEYFIKIAKELGLRELYNDGLSYAYSRHPLAFLMEASDDICYRIIDLEDGHRIDRIPFNEAELILKKIAIKDDRYSEAEYNSLENEKIKIGYLRSKSINYLVFQCFEVFSIKYYEILKGEFDSELLNSIVDKDSLSALKELKELVKKYIYSWRDVLKLEATGFEVLSGLIQKFIDASNLCIECPINTRSKRASKIYELLPDQYCHINDTEELYLRYLKVADYVSGMSDSFAINMFQRIMGIKAIS